MGATYSNFDADGFIESYSAPIYSAGDTNGDGADDLWIGNLLFMGTPFLGMADLEASDKIKA